MKYRLAILLIIISGGFASYSFGQSQLLNGNLTGSFETTTQRYEDDDKTNQSAPPDIYGSNNYLKLDYSAGKIDLGIQYEAYLPPLIGYSTNYKGQGITHKYFSYTDEFLKVTVGNFYDQFGGGLIYRSYESRELGINNSIEGINIALFPTKFIMIKGIYGRQNYYYDLSNGIIRGLDGKVNVLNKNTFKLTLGGSALSKYEEYTGPDDNFPNTVNSFSGRLDLEANSYSVSVEYVDKSADPMLINFYNQEKGNAFLFNFSVFKSGFGLNTSFRSLRNMDSRSNRDIQDDALMVNYLPAITKQHKYSLPNMYPYSTQTESEIGGQLDLYYTFKKGSALGGKYGTKVSVNYSSYFNLDTANTSLFSFGEKLFYQDFNIEIKKKLNKKLRTTFAYVNLLYNKAEIEGGLYEDIKSNTAIADVLYKFLPRKTIRLEVQHLWTRQDKKNWVAGLAELSFAPHWTVFVSDQWNYDYEGKIHYYNVGGSYYKNSTAIRLNYGRQREGILCVGGICRYVPGYKGFSLNLTTSF